MKIAYEDTCKNKYINLYKTIVLFLRDETENKCIFRANLLHLIIFREFKEQEFN